MSGTEKDTSVTFREGDLGRLQEHFDKHPFRPEDSEGVSRVDTSEEVVSDSVRKLADNFKNRIGQKGFDDPVDPKKVGREKMPPVNLLIGNSPQDIGSRVRRRVGEAFEEPKVARFPLQPEPNLSTGDSKEVRKKRTKVFLDTLQADLENESNE